MPTEMTDERYQGFSLKDVCWGYREIFADAIERLFDEGLIGPGRREVTGDFFDLLKRSDQNGFDHVLKEFLAALNPRTRWLLDLPGVFSDVVRLGGELASTRLYYGVRFFETLGAGGFGDSPEQVRHLVTLLRRLRDVDDELAMGLLKGYRMLIERLAPGELERYVRAGLDIHARNPASGVQFLEGTLRSSETYIRSITRECRLEDVSELLERLLRALVGCKVEVGHLGALDSDDLIERGSTVVCLHRWLYLPRRVRDFDDARRNRDFYLLATLVAAAMLADDSFPRVHGLPEYRTCAALVDGDRARLNLFQVAEYVRVLRRMRRRWPGARRLLEFGLSAERAHGRQPEPAAQLFFDALSDSPSPTARKLIALADESVNCFDTARRTEDATDLLAACGGSLRPFSFLPDFGFPGSVSAAPAGTLVADLKNAADRARPADEAEAEDARSAGDADGETPGEQAEEGAAVDAAFVYDEWNQQEGDYYRDYCTVREKVAEPQAGLSIPDDIADEARRVSQVFERFKPDLAHREKYLREGDVINADLLLEYLVQRRREPQPPVRFYERTRINRRDLAVLILLDSSGSTNEQADESEKIIDVEKHAAVILGQGLAALGDRFAVAGFHSNGREHCTYLLFKDFEDDWGRAAIGRVLSSRPANSTRIGPALRHSGHRLTRVDCRQRLIILVTDGRPMDSNYDPNSRYAQYDVRAACEENERRGIHTFAITTEENSLADMEIMFPGRRFAILKDIRRLPRVLPRVYANLTT